MPYKDDSDGPWGSGKKKNTKNDGNKSPWGGNSGNNGSGSGQGETGIPEIDQIVKSLPANSVLIEFQKYSPYKKELYWGIGLQIEKDKDKLYIISITEG